MSMLRIERSRITALHLEHTSYSSLLFLSEIERNRRNRVKRCGI